MCIPLLLSTGQWTRLRWSVPTGGRSTQLKWTKSHVGSIVCSTARSTPLKACAGRWRADPRHGSSGLWRAANTDHVVDALADDEEAIAGGADGELGAELFRGQRGRSGEPP